MSAAGAPPIPIECIDHVALEVADFDGQVARLCAVMQMTCRRIGRYGADQSRRIAMLADERGNKLELIEAPADAEPGAVFMHVAWRVADVDAAFASLVELGWEVLGAPRDIAAARARSAHLLEPSGLAVQLIAYEPDSPDI